MATYTTAGGEMIDQITWRYYGHQIGTTEAVLAAYPGLAAAPSLWGRAWSSNCR